MRTLAARRPDTGRWLLWLALGVPGGFAGCGEAFVGDADTSGAGKVGATTLAGSATTGDGGSEPNAAGTDSLDGGTATTGGAEAIGGAGGETGVTPAPGYADAVLADEPLVYWRMAAKDQVVPDATGGGNDLVLQGTGHELDADGAVRDDDGAIEFDGAKSFAIASSPRPLDFVGTAAFTLECWARRSDGGGGYFQHLLSNVDGVAGNRDGFSLYLLPEPVNDTPRSVFEYNRPAVEVSVWGQVEPVSSWGHYVAVFDGGQAVFYVNGTLTSQKPVEGLLGPRTGPFAVARASTGASFFKGTLDEIAVYAHALDAKAVARHFTFAK